MTAAPILIDKFGAGKVDFTSPDTECYGENACAVMGDIRALWAGDIKGTGQVIFQGAANGVNEMFFSILTHEGNTDNQINYIINEYTNSDADMNCRTIYQGSFNDPNTLFFNTLMHPSNTNFSTNFIISEQIPK